MDMMSIIKEMERNLDNQRAAIELYKSKVDILRIAMENAQKEYEAEQSKLKTIIDDAYAMEQSLEMLKMGSFAQKKANGTKPATVALTKEIPKKTVKKEQTNRHKNAHVIKLNEYDNVLDRWPSQQAAARGMNWDQSSVSRFMKLGKDTQLKRKGFYLAWEF